MMAERDRSESPLRGSLETNDDTAHLHDMGGDIGPADDSAVDHSRAVDGEVAVDDVPEGQPVPPVAVPGDTDAHEDSLGRGADGDTAARREQKREGGP